MKSLLLLLCLGFTGTPVQLLLVDMDGKRPPQFSTSFTLSQYVSRSFPLHAADVNAVIAATEKAARLLDAQPPCGSMDTVEAAHTRIIVKTVCGEGRTVTVRYITRIEELRFLCDFELIRKEPDLRRAQRRLVDFATYLAQ